MKLGVLTNLFSDRPVEDVFKYINSLGLQTVEIGVGGYPGNAHLNPDDLLGNPEKIDKYKELLKKYNLEISAFSVHSNHVHPNREIREKAHSDFTKACKIAKEFDIDTVVSFSGCPGDFAGAKYPNWVTCAWPNDFSEILKYQWEDCLIPYWKEATKLANSYGVNKIALEMHPGFSVYNTGSLLRLREACGTSIGANFDPSHLIWQQMDPVEAIRALKDCIFHFHAKDTKVFKHNTAVNGVLDTSPYNNTLDRSWEFRTVGYGTTTELWKEIMITLSAIGYDGAISIEHEDALMSREEGLEKAVKFLQEIVIFGEKPKAWWV